MSIKLRIILGSIITLQTGLLIGGLSDKWLPGVKAEERKIEPKLLRHLGSHVEGRNSLYNVYCDTERGNLIYSYVVAAENTTSSNLVVIKDGCKGGK